MKWIAMMVVALLLGVSGAVPAAAQSARPSASDQAEALPPPQRARPKILVQPLYPHRHYHSLYPTPYPVEYPGPNAHRECAVRYVQEHRPSGTAIVPRMRCWWARGRFAGP